MDKAEAIKMLDDMIDYVKGHIGSSYSDTGAEDEAYLKELIAKRDSLIAS